MKWWLWPGGGAGAEAVGRGKPSAHAAGRTAPVHGSVPGGEQSRPHRIHPRKTGLGAQGSTGREAAGKEVESELKALSDSLGHTHSCLLKREGASGVFTSQLLTNVRGAFQ